MTTNPYQVGAETKVSKVFYDNPEAFENHFMDPEASYFFYVGDGDGPCGPCRKPAPPPSWIYELEMERRGAQKRGEKV